MIRLSGSDLTIEEVVAVARGGDRVADPPPEVRRRMAASLERMRAILTAGDRPIYGVNTGFGPLAGRRVPADRAARLSRNLILNCCAGIGPPLPREVVRAMMLVRANTLLAGHSGVRPELPMTLIAMLNAGVTPFVPSKGSLGASGDLAPLAHIALVATRDPDAPEGGEGKAAAEGAYGPDGRAWLGDELLPGAEAMRRAGIPRIVPEPKDGLALTNGTTYMVAAAALGVHDAGQLLTMADTAAALSMEALRARSGPLHPALHRAAGQAGQAEAAARLRALLEGSRLIDSEPARVQDAYSLRCVPQVHGPVADLAGFLRSRIAILLNGVSDNPLVFPEAPEGADVLSGGNFHGQGPALWLDLLGIGLAEVGAMSERRSFRLLTPELSDGLPSMLAPESGIDSGLMVPQYTAAALVSENKTLAHPDSVDSIPSSANQEDHVSMGANAARHATEILENVRHILAIEMLTAAQAVDLREDGPMRLGRGTRAAHSAVRSRVRFLEHDRPTTPDIEAIVALSREAAFGPPTGEAPSADPGRA